MKKWSYGQSVMSVVNAFRIGGHTAWNEKWSYGQSVMSVVNAYNAYLGICLSIRLSFFRALKDMAACASISVVNILKLVWWLGICLSIRLSVFCALKDMPVRPKIGVVNTQNLV